MRIILNNLVFLFLLAPCIGHAQTHEHVGSSPESVSHSLSVTGLVPKTVTFTLAEIKKMPTVIRNNVKITGKGGMVKHTLKSMKGVLLKDVLLKSGIDNSNFKESGKMYFVATATDNYKAVFSWSEIFNSAASSSILIVYEEDGKPLKDDGEFILIAINDTVNGLRHVKWLKEIADKKAG